jgi:hypothetical protein
MTGQKYKNSPTTNKNKQAGPIVYTAIPINTRLFATFLCPPKKIFENDGFKLLPLTAGGNKTAIPQEISALTIK